MDKFLGVIEITIESLNVHYLLIVDKKYNKDDVDKAMDAYVSEHMDEEINPEVMIESVMGTCGIKFKWANSYHLLKC